MGSRAGPRRAGSWPRSPRSCPGRPGPGSPGPGSRRPVAAGGRRGAGAAVDRRAGRRGGLPRPAAGRAAHPGSRHPGPARPVRAAPDRRRSPSCPRSALVARFGDGGRADPRSSERAGGRRRSGRSRTPERLVLGLGLEPPIEDLEPLRFVLHRLAGALGDQLARAWRGGRTGRAPARCSTSPSPAGDADRAGGRAAVPGADRRGEAIERLLLARLEREPPPAAVARLELELAEVGPATGQQLGLFVPQAARAARLGWQLARLALAFGEDRIGRVELTDAEAPLAEGRWRRCRSDRIRGRSAVPATASRRTSGGRDPAAARASSDRRRARRDGPAGGDPLGRPTRAGRGLQPLAGRRGLVARPDRPGLLQGRRRRAGWRSSISTASTAPGTSSGSTTEPAPAEPCAAPARAAGSVVRTGRAEQDRGGRRAAVRHQRHLDVTGRRRSGRVDHEAAVLERAADRVDAVAGSGERTAIPGCRRGCLRRDRQDRRGGAVAGGRRFGPRIAWEGGRVVRPRSGPRPCPWSSAAWRPVERMRRRCRSRAAVGAGVVPSPLPVLGAAGVGDVAAPMQPASAIASAKPAAERRRRRARRVIVPAAVGGFRASSVRIGRPTAAIRTCRGPAASRRGPSGRRPAHQVDDRVVGPTIAIDRRRYLGARPQACSQQVTRHETPGSSGVLRESVVPWPAARSRLRRSVRLSEPIGDGRPEPRPRDVLDAQAVGPRGETRGEADRRRDRDACGSRRGTGGARTSPS